MRKIEEPNPDAPAEAGSAKPCAGAGSGSATVTTAGVPGRRTPPNIDAAEPPADTTADAAAASTGTECPPPTWGTAFAARVNAPVSPVSAYVTCPSACAGALSSGSASPAGPCMMLRVGPLLCGPAAPAPAGATWARPGPAALVTR